MDFHDGLNKLHVVPTLKKKFVAFQLSTIIFQILTKQTVQKGQISFSRLL